jgi:hypothetical protein
MREEITISLIGPEPRLHIECRMPNANCRMKDNATLTHRFACAEFGIRHSQFVIVSSPLGLADGVAEFGGAFVIFGFDGALEFFAEFGEVDGALGGDAGAAAAGGDFADVMGRVFMSPLKQWSQVAGEKFVIMLATEQAGLAEFGPVDAAVLAGGALLLFLQTGMHHDEIGQKFVDGGVAFDGEAFTLGGAGLAEVLFDFLAVLDLSEMNGGGLIALVAFHAGSSKSANTALIVV